MTESNLAILQKSKRPAFLAKSSDKAKAFNDFFSAGNSYNGLPSLRIGGKVFTMQLGEKEVVARNSEGDTMSSMLVVLGAARPSKESKAYFAAAYSEEASDGKQPDCYSDDGISPSANVSSPKCASCAVCPLNQLGTAREGKGKACRSFKRVIVVPYSKEHGLLRDPDTDSPQGLALNVPTMSMKGLTQYVKELSDAGIPANAVITKIKFVAESKFPQLEFSASGWLTEEQHDEITQLAESDEKWKATIEISPAFSGTVEPAAADPQDDVEEPAPTKEPKKAPVSEEPAPKPAAKPKAPKKAAEEPAKKPEPEQTTVGKSDDDLLKELDDWGNDDDE